MNAASAGWNTTTTQLERLLRCLEADMLLAEVSGECTAGILADQGAVAQTLAIYREYAGVVTTHETAGHEVDARPVNKGEPFGRRIPPKEPFVSQELKGRGSQRQDDGCYAAILAATASWTHTFSVEEVVDAVGPRWARSTIRKRLSEARLVFDRQRVGFYRRRRNTA